MPVTPGRSPDLHLSPTDENSSCELGKTWPTAGSTAGLDQCDLLGHVAALQGRTAYRLDCPALLPRSTQLGACERRWTRGREQR